MAFDIKRCKKIIATTDKLEISNNFEYTQLLPSDDFKFYLPQIHQSFIEYFVSEYNKGNVITDVLVEYEESKCKCLSCEKSIASTCNYPQKCNIQIISNIKINPNNTTNIKPIKDSWSREDYEFAKYIILRFKNHANIHGYPSKSFKQKVDKWIEENL